MICFRIFDRYQAKFLNFSESFILVLLFPKLYEYDLWNSMDV